MICRRTVDEIAAATVDRPGQTVVELGAGLGTLTAALLRAGARVVAVEHDRRLVAILQTELAHLNDLILVPADATRLDLKQYIPSDSDNIRVAGNLPYSATGTIIKRLVGFHNLISSAVITVQHEVAERLSAFPATSAYGALTVFTRNVYDVTCLRRLPPSVFVPRPKVESAVVRLTPLPSPVTDEDPAFRLLVSLAFQSRRKTLRNALLKSNADPSRVDVALQQASIDGRRRGETLGIEEFARLAGAWETCVPP
jgi:16S rRNA (adenine1518-N6/adenine1519-N6)-dimethyltransferase